MNPETKKEKKHRKQKKSCLEASDKITKVFAVALNGTPSTRLKLTLIGPVLQITDPKLTLEPIMVYLPQYNIEIATRTNHSSIILEPLEDQVLPIIHIKSKDPTNIESWGSAMIDACDRAKATCIDRFQLSVKLLMDGISSTARLIMGIGDVKIRFNDENICVIERGKGVFVRPAPNDIQQLVLKNISNQHFYIRMESQDEAAIVYANLLAPTSNKEAKGPTIVITDTEVPEIDIGFQNALEEVAQTSKKLLSTVLKRFKAPGENATDGDQPMHRKQSKYLPEELDQKKLDEVMEKRLAAVKEKIPEGKEESDKRAMQEIIEQYAKKRGAVECPDLDIQAEIPEPLFKIPETPLTNAFVGFREERRNLQRWSILDSAVVDDFVYSPSALLLTHIAEIEPSMKANYAAGVFLACRKVPIDVMYDQLLLAHLGDLRLTKFRVENPFLNGAMCVDFFEGLFEKGLVGSFFRQLANCEQFVRKCYFSDAIVASPEMCLKLPAAFEDEYEPAEDNSLPFSDFDNYYIRIQNELIDIQTKCIRIFVRTEEGDDSDELDPLSCIIYSLCGFFTDSMNCGIHDLFKAFQQASDPVLEEMNEYQISVDAKVVSFFLKKIASRTMNEWILSAIDTLYLEPDAKGMAKLIAHVIEGSGSILGEADLTELPSLASIIAKRVCHQRSICRPDEFV